MKLMRSGKKKLGQWKPKGFVIGITALFVLSAFLTIAPNVAAAVNYGTLYNHNPAMGEFWVAWWGEDNYNCYKVPVYAGYYTAIGTVPQDAASDDLDLEGYTSSDFDASTFIARSTRGPGYIDAIIVNCHEISGDTYYYIKAYPWGWTVDNEYYIESDSQYASGVSAAPSASLEVGTTTTGSFLWGAGYNDVNDAIRGNGAPVLNCHDVRLFGGGKYKIRLGNVPLGEYAEVYLYKDSGALLDYVEMGSYLGATVEDYLNYTVPSGATGWYGIVVTSGRMFGEQWIGNYDIIVHGNYEIDAPITTDLIAPGQIAEYDITLQNQGMMQDIIINTNWEGTAPTGAIVNISGATPPYTYTPAIGVEDLPLTITVDNTSGVSAGSYTLNVTFDDTSETDLDQWQLLTMDVSTTPDFSVVATPSSQKTNPGEGVTYDITVLTINDYVWNVTLSTTISPLEPTITTSFNPNPVNLTVGYVSTLTVNSTETTPLNTYTITITGVNDTATLTRSTTVNFEVAETISVSIVAPIAGQTITGTYKFKVSASSDVGVDFVQMTFGGVLSPIGSVIAGYSTASGYYEYEVNTNTYPDGSATITATGTDNDGYSRTVGPITFNVDNTPSSPTIDSPTAGSYVNGTWTIQVTTDSNVVSARYKIDAGTWVQMSGSGTSWSADWDTTDYVDGTHTLTVETKDSVGLIGSTSINVIVDNNYPTVSIVKPIAEQYVSGTLVLQVSAQDDGGIKSVKVNIDESGTWQDTTFNTATGYYEYTIETGTMIDGAHNVTARAFDEFRNTTSSLVNFYVDNTAPTLIINSPTEGTIVTGNVNVSCNSTDSGFTPTVEYRIDSGTWKDLTDGPPDWNATWDTTKVIDGVHTVYYKSSDEAGHETIDYIIVTVDNEEPTASIIAPSEGEYVSGMYTFQVLATDQIGVESAYITFGGNDYSLSYSALTGYWQTTLDTNIIADGTYTLNATVSDAIPAHDYTTPDKTFNIDNTPPTLVINKPSPNDILSGFVEINASSTDVGFIPTVEFRIDAGSWFTLSGGPPYWNATWDSTTVADGSHTIYYRTTDPSGKKVENSIPVIVDNNNPSGFVASPGTGEYLSGLYTFKVQATDIVGVVAVNITIDTVEYTCSFNTQTGYWERAIDTYSLGDGSHTVFGTIWDNVASHTVSTTNTVDFWVDNYAPTLSIIAPVGGSLLTGDVLIEVNSSDPGPSVPTVEYRIDSGAWTTMSGSEPLWNATWNTATALDGSHTITVRSSDGLGGHSLTVQIGVTTDNVNPSATIASPSPGEYISGLYTVQVSASDTIEVASVTVVINTTPPSEYACTLSLLTGYWEVSIGTDGGAFADGYYAIYARAEDTTGHTNLSATVNFYIDNTAPTLVINTPAGGDLVYDTITVSVDSDDPGFGSQLDVRYRVDSGPWLSLSGGPPTWTATLDTTPYSDALHTLSFITTDPSGKSTSTSITVTIDNGYPAGQIIRPGPGEYLQDYYTFQVKASDTIGVASVTLQIDTAEYLCAFNSLTGYWECDIDTTTAFTDGAYTVVAIINDTVVSHSVTTASVSFYIDNNKPVLSINSPVSGDIVYNTVTVSVDATDIYFGSALTVVFRVDSGDWNAMTGGPPAWTASWDTTILSDGDHLLTFKCTDPSGKESSESVTVVVDNNAPTGAIVSPSPGAWVSGFYTVQITASDYIAVEYVGISINGGPLLECSYNALNGYWERVVNTDTPSYPDGTYNISATIKDTALLHTYVTDIVDFGIDNHAPSISIVYPAAGEKVSGTISIQVTASDEGDTPLEVWYRIDTFTPVLMGGSEPNFNAGWDTTLVLDGGHTLLCKAIDGAGYEVSTSISITVDNEAPSGYIAAPSVGERIEGYYTFLVGAIDTIGVANVNLYIDSSVYSCTYNSITGYWQYSIDTTGLADGTYTVYAEIADYVPLTFTTDTIEFHIDNTYPTLAINSPLANEILPGTITVSVDATDPGFSAELEVTYRIDTGTWLPLTGGPPTWTASWDTTGTTDGTHTLSFRVVDPAGHQVMSTITIIVDNGLPTGTIAAPVAGEYIEGFYTFRVTASDLVGVTSVIISFGGSNYETTFNTVTGGWETTIDTTTLIDGKYNVTAIISDNIPAHTITIGPQNFSIDNQAPTLTVISPEVGEIVTGTTYEVLINSYDIGFVPTVEFRVDAGEWKLLSLSGGDPTLWEYLWDTSVLPDGSHELTFRSRDPSGHARSITFTVITDNTNPSVTLLSPRGGDFIEGHYTFTAGVTDVIGVAYVILRIDSTNYTMNYNIQTGNYEYSFDLTDETKWTNGEYTCVVYAEDRARLLTVTEQITFTVDNSIPQLQILSHLSGEEVSGTIRIEVKATDWNLRLSEITANPIVEWQVDDKGWDTMDYNAQDQIHYIEYDTLLLADGEHTFEFVVADTAGHTVAKKLVLIVDNALPAPPVITSLAGEFIRGVYTFRISQSDVEEIKEVWLTIKSDDGTKILTDLALYNGGTEYYEYVFGTTVHADGTYIASACAYDLLGHKLQGAEVTFYIDNHPPGLQVLYPNPQEGKPVSGICTIKYNITNEPFFLKAEYNVDGFGWVDITTPWNTYPLYDGKHILIIRAWDKSGQVTEERLTVITDNTEPEIVIVTPSASDTVKGTFKVIATVTTPIELVNVNVTIGKEQAKLTFDMVKDDVTGRYEITIDTIKHGLPDGIYDLKVSATSLGLHTATVSIPIEIDNTGPHIVSVKVENIGPDKKLFRIKVTDATGIEGVKLKIDEEDWLEVPYDAVVDEYRYVWSTADVVPGPHSYQVMAWDVLGNEATEGTETRTVTVEEHPKTFTEVFGEWLPFIGLILFLSIFGLVLLVLRSRKVRKALVPEPIFGGPGVVAPPSPPPSMRRPPGAPSKLPKAAKVPKHEVRRESGGGGSILWGKPPMSSSGKEEKR